MRLSGGKIMINRNATQFYRHNLMTAVSLVALVTATAVTGTRSAEAADNGQTAQAETAQAPKVEEIVVTGSRIVRNGYEAPTPVSVLSADDLNLGGEGNITDTIVKMPVFSGSALPRGKATSSDVTGTAGFSVLNLRSIGTNRTLVLFDGKRMAGSSVDGTVDTNLIPDGVVKRIDVVTGGASAVYGSDAISGVVNFVLDKEFTGVKGSVEGGLTDYGDEKNYKITLSAGVPFANGRGHFLAAFEHMYSGGVSGCPRDWCQNHNYQTVVNPTYTATNGQPQYLAVYDTGNSLAAPGGLITGGPLKGTYFGIGGQTGQLNYGTVSGGYIIGGDWRFTNFQNNPNLPINFDTDLSFKQSRRWRIPMDIGRRPPFRSGMSSPTPAKPGRPMSRTVRRSHRRRRLSE
jgi:outer membrane receptor protein involved in Fe transport